MGIIGRAWGDDNFFRYWDVFRKIEFQNDEQVMNLNASIVSPIPDSAEKVH
jgi:hypothetical protein